MGEFIFFFFFPFVLMAVLTIRITWEIPASHLEEIVMIKQWSKEIFEIVYNLFWMCTWLFPTEENHDTDSKEKLVKHSYFYLHREVSNEASAMSKSGCGSKVILTSSSFLQFLAQSINWNLGKLFAIYRGCENGLLGPPWSGIYVMALLSVCKNWWATIDIYFYSPYVSLCPTRRKWRPLVSFAKVIFLNFFLKFN